MTTTTTGLTRKPRKGDRIRAIYEDGRVVSGTVTAVGPDICHFCRDGNDSPGAGDMFIWYFAGDQTLNTCFTIVEVAS